MAAILNQQLHIRSPAQTLCAWVLRREVIVFLEPRVTKEESKALLCFPFIK